MNLPYIGLLILFLAACSGSPDPTTLGPTASKPIFFETPSNNQVVESGQPIQVRLSLANDQEFVSVTLMADNRAVRLLELYDGVWEADLLDEVLLTFLPGEHTLTAYAETENGDVYSRKVTVYAAPEPPEAPVTPTEIRITEVIVVNIETGMTYGRFNSLESQILPEIPIEDLQNEGIAFRVDYEGDVYSMYFTSSALEESIYRYGDQAFEITIGGDDQRVSAGDYDLYIRPYRSVGGDLITSPSSVIVPFRVLDSRLQIKTRSLDLLQSLNNMEPVEGAILIENLGNRAGEYHIQGIPDWLMLSEEGGSLGPGENTAVIATAQACTHAISESAVLNVVANGTITDVTIKYECVDGTLFDLSLDRFYFNQSIPVNDSQGDPKGAIELVKGRDGIARAFVRTTDALDFRLPQVTLFYRTANGHEGRYDLVGPSAVPKNIYEGFLDQTFNTKLPKAFFEQGTEFYVVVDPDNEIAERFEGNNRYPSEGYLPLKIREVPPLKLTFIPMVHSGDDAPPLLSEDSIPVLMQTTMALMPLEDYDVSIRDQPFVFNRAGWDGALTELIALRQLEQPEGFYFGIVSDEVFTDSSIAGKARINGAVAVGLPQPSVIAHELGHNFGLRHVDCGAPPRPDPNYPHEDGQTNLWGYNIFSEFLKAPSDHDFMSYCQPEWISAYHYRKILLKRGGVLFPAREAVDTSQKAQVQSFDIEQELFIINGIIDGPFANLNHAYTTIGLPSLNSISSPYIITLVDKGGVEVYRTGLDVEATSHSTQQRFTVKIPARQINITDIKRVIIESNDVVYLDKPWQSNGQGKLEKMHVGSQVSRISSDKVRIRWQADGDTSLWVTDSETKNIIGVDATGEIIVFSTSNQLEFKYTREGRQTVKVLSVD